MSPARSTRAFTLLEILIAMLIFSTVIAAIYACWSSILRSTKVGLDAAARVQRQRIAVKALEEALFSVQFFQENAHYYSFEMDTSGDFAALSFVARLPRSFPRGGNFEDQVVRRVTFAVEPGPSRENLLVLRQQPILFDANVDEDENPLVLARDVNGFVVEFWGPNSREWEPEWLYTNQLPKLIRFSLSFGNPTAPRQPADVIANVVALSSIPIPRSLQVSGPQQGGTKIVQPPPQP
jgi:prepilin-type N-terminal cleavage/methylation domain-containing protein